MSDGVHDAISLTATSAVFASITTTPLSTRSSTSRNGTATTAATRSTRRSGRIARSAEPRGSSDEEG